MKLAFCLYKYFPYGGLQRDFLRIAGSCVDRGHQVSVYCMSWQGEQPDGLSVEIEAPKSVGKLGKYRKFTTWFQERMAAEQPDLIVGFNKMPGLDVYYAADPCFENKARNLRRGYYRYSPRYRHFSRYEHAVFDPEAETEILLISTTQAELFKQYYRTPPERLHLLPPGIDPGRRAPDNAAEIRRSFRREFGLDDDQMLALMIGSGFRIKGVDRSLKAMAALPEDLKRRVRLFIIGQDNPREFRLLARRLGILEQVTFLAGRDDIPRFLLGADLLLHPAYNENTGTVLLEAVVAGLPVLVTDVCGYAHYVAEAHAGELIPTPFHQATFNCQFESMLRADKSQWRRNGLKFAETADIYSMPERAVDIIEAVGRRKKK